MKNAILLLLFCSLSSQLFAIKKDSLNLKNSLEISYQRNYSSLKIVSYNQNGPNAAARIAEKDKSESAVYTNIISILYTYNITKWLFVKSGFSTGTLGIIGEPYSEPVYNPSNGHITGYKRSYYGTPLAFLSSPFIVGGKIKLFKSNFYLGFNLGYEGRYIKSPFLDATRISTYENSKLYRYKIEKNIEVNDTIALASSAFTNYKAFSLTPEIRYSTRRFFIKLFYQYRRSATYRYYTEKYGNLSIKQYGYAHSLGFAMGYNF